MLQGDWLAKHTDYLDVCVTEIDDQLILCSCLFVCVCCDVIVVVLQLSVLAQEGMVGL